MSEAAQTIFADWSLPVWLTLSIVVTAAVYLRGWLAIRKTRPAQFTGLRLASFLVGLGVLWLSIGSPMDGFADALLSAHMIEHLLLMSVVPPLLLWGMPVVPLLRGLPGPLRSAVIGPLLRIAQLRRFVRWLGSPLVAWLMMNITFLAWHIPKAYDFALEHENWHAVEHICFLFSSSLFWWCILRPWPASWQQQNWGILLYLVAADIVNTMLSAFLAFCGRPVYAYYLNHANPFQVSPLNDQVLGAVVMWVIGSFAFLVPAMLIALRLAGLSQQAGSRQKAGI
ncbi:MAG TPA: cytochrome c oxidase assembly protein [Terracidiphilus sp.]|jgi:cytochrome c oxidase assembly factor CtaG